MFDFLLNNPPDKLLKSELVKEKFQALSSEGMEEKMLFLLFSKFLITERDSVTLDFLEFDKIDSPFKTSI